MSPSRTSSGQAQPEASSSPRALPFSDPETASHILARFRARLSPSLAAALPALLADSPDPDSSLLQFDRLLSDTSAEVLRLLERHPHLAHYAIVVFGHSRFLGETLVRNPDLLQSFLRDKNLDRSFSREEFREGLARFRSRSFDKDAALLLARFKRREYVRIMLRDVLRLAPLAETTAEISALADVLIEEALREAQSQLQARYGTPQHVDPSGRQLPTPFSILSLGKLGGNELNYSSDVDLMYLYGDGEEPPHQALSNREYFIRLAQQVTGILSRITPEGAVFRIDLRLRPQGGQGELAISLGHALHYYAEIAHDWELQAMIKLRHSAGDTPLARAFIRGVQPRVYGCAADSVQTAERSLNFAAIETALTAREKIHRRRHRSVLEPSGQSVNLKLDRGGIRDIEFLVQCLQRVYGGAEPWLRSGGTLFSLQKLHDKGHLTSKEFHELTNAYQFLRHLEHRLQLRQGQQTHRLPASADELRVLQRALADYQDGESRKEDLVALVERRMAAVAEIYHRIIHQQQAHQFEHGAGAEFRLRGSHGAGLAEQSNRQILEQLAGDSPALYRILDEEPAGFHARKNLLRFLSSALTSSERYAAVVQHPEAVRRALALFEASDYLTDILVRHPEEVSTLEELAEEPAPANPLLFARDRGVRIAGDAVFTYLATADLPYGEKLALLRQHYRHRVFAAGAADILRFRDVYQSLASTSAAAEDAIAAAYQIAGAPPGLSIMALGRLGTSEFDILSDADVLFLYDRSHDRLALTKAAEQIMQVLAAYTRDGMVFPVDPRLRPRGAEGELLITPEQLLAYFQHEAQPWEALMYSKLRFLAGAAELGRQALTATQTLFQRFASDPDFPQAVRDMRAKLESGGPNLKTSPGAIYDIDFLAASLLVKNAVKDRRGTLRDRLWSCAEAGWLEKADAATLDHAAELFRTVEHVTRLVVGRARKWLPAGEHALRAVERLTSQILSRHFPGGLEAELHRNLAQVRGIYSRLV